MTPTEQLKNEHQAIKMMLKILEAICARGKQSGDFNIEHLRGIVEFIRVFADKCHHAKEEDLLFPAMVEAGIPAQGGPIGVMLEEHEIGRNYVRAFSEAVEQYEKGDKNAIEKIIYNATGYVNLLREHIGKEDDILYPMADMSISANKQDELMQSFDKIEEEKVGHGKHEEFHRFLEELEKIYLR